MTHWFMWYDVWHDSLIYVTWFIHDDSFACVTRLIHTCDKSLYVHCTTNSCLWHDSFMRVTSPIRVQGLGLRVSVNLLLPCCHSLLQGLLLQKGLQQSLLSGPWLAIPRLTRRKYINLRSNAVCNTFYRRAVAASKSATATAPIAGAVAGGTTPNSRREFEFSFLLPFCPVQVPWLVR